MAGSVNKVILVGNLGRDPDIRSMQSGGRVCNLSIATSETWKDRNSGERREKTEWHRVVIFSEPLVGIAERFLKKGSKVYVEGQLETRKYTDQNNQERYTTEVVLRPYRGELTMLDGGRGGEGAGFDDRGGGNDRGGPGGGGTGSGGRSDQGGGQRGGWDSGPSDFDDEIPF